VHYWAELIIKNIKKYAKLNDPEKAEKHRKKQISSADDLDIYFDVAYEAVYKYRDGYCENECVDDVGVDYNAYSAQIVHLFRRIASTCSKPFRPPVPKVIVQ
jgi:hypothetical protein